MAKKNTKSRYWVDDNSILPEIVITPQGNYPVLDEAGNPARTVGAIQDINPNAHIYERVKTQPFMDDYIEGETTTAANQRADALDTQVVPHMGDFVSAATKPLDVLMPSRWVGLLDKDYNGLSVGDRLTRLFDEHNKGLYINDNPAGLFSKRFHDEHPIWAMAGNTAFDIASTPLIWNGANKAYEAGEKILNSTRGLAGKIKGGYNLLYGDGVSKIEDRIQNIVSENASLTRDLNRAYVEQLSDLYSKDSHLRGLKFKANELDRMRDESIIKEEANRLNISGVDFSKMSKEDMLEFFKKNNTTGIADYPERMVKAWDSKSGTFIVKKDEAPFPANDVVTTGDDYIRNLKTGEVQKIHIDSPNAESSLHSASYNPKTKEITINSPVKKSLTTENKVVLPENYRELVKSNIDYVTNEILPGSKVFGSASNIEKGNLQHLSHDIDVIMTEKQAMQHPEFKSWYSKRADTYGWNHPEAGELDINVIRENADGHAQGDLAHELYAQMYPKEYYEYILSSIKKGKTIDTNLPLPITPEELLKSYDPVTKGILDAFASNKPKHVGRALYYLHYGDIKDVRKGFNMYANYLLGGKYKPTNIPLSEFNDSRVNSEIIDLLGLKAINKEAFINDPERMKLLVDYAVLDKTFVGRGVDSGDDIIKSLTYWYPNTNNGTYNGVGLNTVLGGNSKHGSVYATIVPKRMPSLEGNDVKSVLKQIEDTIGNKVLSSQEQDEVLKMAQEYGISLRDVSTLKDVLGSTSGSQGENYKLFLNSLAEKFNVPIIQGRYYGNSTYASLLEDQSEEAIQQFFLSSMDRPIPSTFRDDMLYNANDNIRDAAEALEYDINKAIVGRNKIIRQKYVDNKLPETHAQKLDKIRNRNYKKRSEVADHIRQVEERHEASIKALKRNYDSLQRRIETIRRAVKNSAIGTLTTGTIVGGLKYLMDNQDSNILKRGIKAGIIQFDNDSESITIVDEDRFNRYKRLQKAVEEYNSAFNNNNTKAYGGLLDMANKFKDGGSRNDYNTWKKKIKDYKGIIVDGDDTYDYYNFFKDNPQMAWDMLSDNPEAHFTDRYKTPNHPTYSNESIYSRPPYIQGGTWNDYSPTVMGQKWNYALSPSQVNSNWDIERTINYLADAENEGAYVTDNNGRYPIVDGTVLGGTLTPVTVTPNNHSQGGSLKLASWNDLSMREKADIIKVGVKHGLNRLDDIKSKYNEFALGGNLYDEGGPKTRMTADGRTLHYSTVPTTGEVRWIDFDDSKDFDGVTGYRFYDNAGNKMHYTQWQDNADYLGIKDATGYVLPEVEVLGKDLAMRAHRHLDDPLLGGELKNNQYTTMPAQSQLDDYADMRDAQVVPHIGNLVGAALKPSDALMPTKWVGLLDKDYDGLSVVDRFSRLFDENNRGLFINDNPYGLFSKRYAEEHPYWAMAGNTALDIVSTPFIINKAKEAYNVGKNAVENAPNAMQFLNSPYTGKWIRFGNREYRFKPGYMGMNGTPIESRIPRITEENAASMTPEQWDAAQRAAWEAGDLAERQRLRNLHFKVRQTGDTIDADGNPIHEYHGSPEENITEFYKPNDPRLPASKGRNVKATGEEGIYTSPKKKYAARYVEDLGGRYRVPLTKEQRELLKAGKTREEIGLPPIPKGRIYDLYSNTKLVPEDLDIDFNPLSLSTEEANLIKSRGYSGFNTSSKKYPEHVVLEPNQLKLADADTFDDAGNLIPLSQRDNFKVKDIRYGLIPWLLGTGTAAATYRASQKNNNVKAYGGLLDNINLFGDGGGFSFPWQAPNTLAESMAANMQALQAKQQEERKRKARADSKEARKKTIEKGRNLVKRDTRNYFTTSNDATAVHSTITGDMPLAKIEEKKQNPHLEERAIVGAKKYRVMSEKFAEDHPVLNTLGYAAGLAPFIVPAATATAAVAPVLSDAVAATKAGEAAVNGFNWMANATKAARLIPWWEASPTVAEALPWVDAGLTSYFGAHGINDAVNGNFNLMTPLELMPLGRVAKPMAKGAYDTMYTLYDNGTLWDKYTTFRGRFGNYGDNLATNIYGTLARNYGLPDKARVPADAMRKISKPIKIEDGLVDFTGNKGFGDNYHINMTLDRPTVSHHWWVGDGADTYIMPTRSFLEQTKGSLKSIEPSDMFANGARVRELPQNVTLISGDIEALNKAREAGMQTLSSPKLRRIYKQKMDEYLQELSNIDKLPPEEQIMIKPPVHPKVVKNDRGQKYWPEYAAEVQRLQARRGSPTLEDFRMLEQQTGLNAGVAPITEYYNALNQIKLLPFDENGVVLPLVYPNGREAVISSPSNWQKEERILKTPYNKVFYDPASTVESDWKTLMGMNN